MAEARHLAAEGFRNVLLVAGEHPKFVSNGYLEACVRAVCVEAGVPGVSLEVGPMETDEYRPLVGGGRGGSGRLPGNLSSPDLRRNAHGGPKRDFDWRLDCPERAYAAGFRRLGDRRVVRPCTTGARRRAHSPRTSITFATLLEGPCERSACRGLRPAAGGFAPRFPLADRELVQLLCAFRLTFPQVGIVLSTREVPGPARCVDPAWA